MQSESEQLHWKQLHTYVLNMLSCMLNVPDKSPP